jgi:hypothetical protein
MENEESVLVNPYVSTTTKSRDSIAVALICITLVAAAIGWGKGVADYSSMIDARWRQAGFADWIMDSSFQTKYDDSSCTGSATYGCGRYMVVSKYDCGEVSGSMSFETPAGKTLEYIDTRVTNVHWGEPFVMQFDATAKGAAATKINLFELKCTR